MASPNDVSRILFTVLRLNAPKGTKKLQSGEWSTMAKVRCSDWLSCRCPFFACSSKLQEHMTLHRDRTLSSQELRLNSCLIVIRAHCSLVSTAAACVNSCHARRCWRRWYTSTPCRASSSSTAACQSATQRASLCWTRSRSRLRPGRQAPCLLAVTLRPSIYGAVPPCQPSQSSSDRTDALAVLQPTRSLFCTHDAHSTGASCMHSLVALAAGQLASSSRCVAAECNCKCRGPSCMYQHLACMGFARSMMALAAQGAGMSCVSGRILQTSSATGRLAMESMNLQCLPKHRL